MNEGTAYGPAAGAGSEMAELARLADELIDEIGAARRHYDDLRAVLDGQMPEDGHGHGGEHAPDAPAALDEAHLVALSLALTGGDRDDARAHLRDAFGIGIDEANEILDQAFGTRFDGVAVEAQAQRRFGRRRRRAELGQGES